MIHSVYTWPKQILDGKQKIPSTEKWGEVISLDKTVPEFHLGIILLVSLLPIVTIQYYRKIPIF